MGEMLEGSSVHYLADLTNFAQEPYDHCTDHPKEYCEDVKVKVARRHCRQKDKKDKTESEKDLLH